MGSIVTPNRPLPSHLAPLAGQLSDEMIADYHDAGVLILRDFVSVAKCHELRARALQMLEQFDLNSVRSVFSTTEEEQLDDSYFIESGDKIRFFMEPDAFDEDGKLRQEKAHSINKMGHAMHDLDPVFDEFSRTAELGNIVAGLGFRQPAIIQSMYLFKPPRIGGEVQLHQDSTYIYTEPESCVGFWFALQDATIENGCMEFLYGGHKSPLRRRNRRQADGKLTTETIDDTPWPDTKLSHAEASAGTLVIFDGRTPHLSAANRSAHSRHAYSLHVIDRECHYPVENWLQRDAMMPLRGFINSVNTP